MIQIKHFVRFSAFTIIASILFSCNRIDNIEIEESDVVEIIETALQSNSGGPTSDIENTVQYIDSSASSGGLCDTMYNETLSRNFQGTKIQANYSSTFSYQMSCNNLNIPQTATFSIATNTNYSTNRITGTGNSTFNGSLTGLEFAASSIIFNGNYSRTGTQELAIQERKNISSTLNFSLSDIDINKPTFIIQSGSGTFSFIGTVQGTTFNYSGNITFNGNQNATLIINGNSYSINWD